MVRLDQFTPSQDHDGSQPRQRLDLRPRQQQGTTPTEGHARHARNRPSHGWCLQQRQHRRLRRYSSSLPQELALLPLDGSQPVASPTRPPAGWALAYPHRGRAGLLCRWRLNRGLAPGRSQGSRANEEKFARLRACPRARATPRVQIKISKNKLPSVA